MHVAHPLFLITSPANCWRCHAPQEVVALGSPRVDDGDLETLGAPEDGEIVLLQEIETLPPELAAFIQTVAPRVRLRYSKTAELSYLANHCECGANFGDFYLHEMGGPFGPMDASQASRMTISQVPLDGPFEITASWHMGPGDLINEHAKRR